MFKTRGDAARRAISRGAHSLYAPFISLRYNNFAFLSYLLSGAILLLVLFIAEKLLVARRWTIIFYFSAAVLLALEQLVLLISVLTLCLKCFEKAEDRVFQLIKHTQIQIDFKIVPRSTVRKYKKSCYMSKKRNKCLL